MAKLCRLCAELIKQNHSYVVINKDKTDIFKQIRDHLHLQLNSRILTEQICNTCLETVQEFNQFYRKVHEKQKYLVKLFKTYETRKSTSLDSQTNVLQDDTKACRGDERFDASVEVKYDASIDTNVDDNKQLNAKDNHIVGKDLETKQKIKKEDKTSNDMEITGNVFIKQENDTDMLDRIDNAEADRTTTEIGLSEIKIEEDMIFNFGTEDEAIVIIENDTNEYLNADGNAETEADDIEDKCGNETSESNFSEDGENQKKHLPVHTEEKPFLCKFCTKNFKTRAHLKIHLRTHTNEKPYKCKVCSKRFTLNGNLTKHLIVHSKDKPYKCTDCYKRFASPSRLKGHLTTHSKETPYNCSFCPKKFRSKIATRCHLVKIHLKKRNFPNLDKAKFTSKETPFKCDKCGKCYAGKSYLTRHLKTHSEDLKFKCSECPKAFTLSCYLKQHLKYQHTEDKDFKCQHCAKAFKYKHSLKVHLLAHTKEELNKCNKCSKTFKEKTQLEEHLKRHYYVKPAFQETKQSNSIYMPLNDNSPPAIEAQEDVVRICRGSEQFQVSFLNIQEKSINEAESHEKNGNESIEQFMNIVKQENDASQTGDMVQLVQNEATIEDIVSNYDSDEEYVVIIDDDDEQLVECKTELSNHEMYEMI